MLLRHGGGGGGVGVHNLALQCTTDDAIGPATDCSDMIVAFLLRTQILFVLASRGGLQPFAKLCHGSPKT